MAITEAQPTGRSRWALYCPDCGQDIEVSVTGLFFQTAPQMPVPKHDHRSKGGPCSGVSKLATPHHETEFGFGNDL